MRPNNLSDFPIPDSFKTMDFLPAFQLLTEWTRQWSRYLNSSRFTIVSCVLSGNCLNDAKQVSPMAMDDGQAAERQTWGNPVEFLMSCIAMSVGLGNLTFQIDNNNSNFVFFKVIFGVSRTLRTRTAAERSSFLI